MRTRIIIVLVLLLGCVSVLSARHQRSVSREEVAVTVWFEQHLWRAGGVDHEEVVRFYSRALRAGGPDLIRAMNQAVQTQIREGYLDPRFIRPLYSVFDEVEQRLGAEKFSAKRSREWMEKRAAIASMDPRTRGELYRRCIEAGCSYEAEYPHCWVQASLEALRCQDDWLVPLIEKGLVVHELQKEQKRMAVSLRDVWLPLAAARRSGDWVEGYLEIIRKEVAAQVKVREYAREDYGNQRVRRALLELVHRNQRQVADELLQLWRSLKEDPASVESAKIQLQRGWVKEPSGETPRSGPVAEMLVFAIRALKAPDFQKAFWKWERKRTAEDVEAELMGQGLLTER